MPMSLPGLDGFPVSEARRLEVLQLPRCCPRPMAHLRHPPLYPRLSHLHLLWLPLLHHSAPKAQADPPLLLIARPSSLNPLLHLNLPLSWPPPLWMQK
jgi:hypothetical protein